MTTLRYYQNEAIDAVFNYWRDGEAGNPLVELATGTGKSVVLADLLKRLITQYPLMRVLVLVHVRELVAQNYQQLIRLWPQAPAGINSAGLGRRDTTSQILFASVQSIYKNPRQIGRRDLVLIDEAHLIPAPGKTQTIGSDGMYHSLLDGLRSIYADLRVMGCTATPYRLDSGRLDKGEHKFFDRIVYSYGISEGVADGFLAPLVSKGMKAEINVTEVAKRGGEFISGALEKVADTSDLVAQACDEMVQYGAARRSWLVFCSGVDHAGHVSEALNARGILSAVVTGDTPKAERDRILTAFKAGQIRAICNMSVLTTGFDAPCTDLIALLRPTLSTGLYVQMLGRGTRLAHNKQNCLVLDFSGNVRRHGPVDMIEVGGKRKADAGPSDLKDEVAVSINSVKAKCCPSCQALVPLRTPFCDDCGYEWPVDPKHEAKADVSVSVMSGKDRDGYVPCVSVGYYKHVKRGVENPIPTLRVSYLCGAATISTWQCFSHPQGSSIQRKAASWWLEAGGSLPIPVSVDEAVLRSDSLNSPTAIKWKRSASGFDEVIGRRYQTQMEVA